MRPRSKYGVMINKNIEPQSNIPSSENGYISNELEHSLSINPGNAHYRTQTMNQEMLAN